MNDTRLLLSAIERLTHEMQQANIALKIRIYELTEAVKHLEASNGNNKESQSSEEPSFQRETHTEQGQTDSVQE